MPARCLDAPFVAVDDSIHIRVEATMSRRVLREPGA